ncbi:peptidylprolyl isomerase [Larkinella punicea]|uniref:Peptidyl-prolyl cis-trans isomerase n=2 Tax=Larkinella punicea TaxID=2315727 RepID=A0A368JUJ7_9BACT|nr:peptidylprolyl isomerase [Larkinella punicea]
MAGMKNWLKWNVAVSLIGLLIAQESCAPDPGEALNDRKRRENEEEIKAYIAQESLPAAKDDVTGLYLAKTKTVPTGQTPVVGDEVRFYFVQRRLDGVIVDSSETFAKKPSVVTIGAPLQGTITARLYTGLQLLKEGEEGIVLAPYDPTDNKSGNLLLPAYTPVRYDITVVSVRTEEEQIQDYLVAKGLTAAEKTASGLRFLLTKAYPDSALVKVGQSVKIKYKGTLLNGNQFDANADGADFNIGTGAVIAAWDEALVKMREGEKATIVLPSTIGYGQLGKAPIPPYASLAFDIEVVSAK